MTSVEDYISIDQELDCRIGRLSICLPAEKQARPNLKESRSRPQNFIVENQPLKIQIHKSQHEKEPIYKPYKYANSLEATRGEIPILFSDQINHQSSNDNLEDFLTEETQVKLASMKMKNEYLAKALVASEQKIKHMMKELNDHKKNVKDANKETTYFQKLLSSSQSLLEKKEAELKEAKEALENRTKHCQELNKTINALQKQGREDEKKLLQFQAQHNRLKKQSEDTKIKISNMAAMNKEEKDSFITKNVSNEKKCQDLEKKVQSLSNIIRKHNELILVLQEQKSNIAAAKAIQCLEDKFIAMIEPLQDQSLANRRDGAP